MMHSFTTTSSSLNNHDVWKERRSNNEAEMDVEEMGMVVKEEE